MALIKHGWFFLFRQIIFLWNYRFPNKVTFEKVNEESQQLGLSLLREKEEEERVGCL